MEEKQLTRKEQYLTAIAEGDVSAMPEKPLTREEVLLEKIAKKPQGSVSEEVISRMVQDKINDIAEPQGKLLDTESSFMMGENKAVFFTASYYDNNSKTLYYGGYNPTNGRRGLMGVDFSDLSNPQLVKYSDLALSSLGLKSGSPSIRGITKHGNYLYVAVRSTDGDLPSDGMDNNSVWGALLCVNINDLSVVWTKKLNAKVANVDIFTSSSGKIYLALPCQMSYIQFYEINPNDPTEITLKDTQYTSHYSTVDGWEDYLPNVGEFQNGAFYETSNHRVLYISCGFADGVHIFDITNVSSENRATLYDWRAQLQSWWKINGKSSHTMACVVDYPYVYCTYAPEAGVARADLNNGTSNRRMGVVALNISNLSNITSSIHYIATEDMNDFTNDGDTRPTYIVKYANRLFLDNGNKGIAIFEVINGVPNYLKTVDEGFFNVKGLLVSNDLLFAGDSPAGQTSGSETFVAPKYIKVFTPVGKDYDFYMAILDEGLMSNNTMLRALRDWVNANFTPKNESLL